LPYVLHNVGKERWQEMGPAARRIQGGPFKPVPGGKREAHYRRTGHMQVPYLEDPNTGTRLLESTRILDYLDSTYAV
ncbi:MAG TPA: glutathione S-transferase N-terminal domain-containing protein, partial [Candidatus Macondimonas sp.]|nr:glutathione S-transferase N-terminal domain-containing protein [Candidatus Macondimonas sp.]